MKRMAVSNVLVVGMKGLGVEIGESISATYDGYFRILLLLLYLQPRTSA